MSTPAPTTDALNQPFWDALAERRVTVQRCTRCDHRWVPRVPSCPWCATPDPEVLEVPGTGSIYSFVRVHRALTPAMADDVPYTVATVDLDDGGRLTGRVEPAEAAAIGVRVEPRFVAHDGWTELRFAADA